MDIELNKYTSTYDQSTFSNATNAMLECGEQIFNQKVINSRFI
ncbi:hypothetical protein SAMN06265348_103322 [Pedobacter westerhofensis]|uniref:Uncharacterized protein n=1 Tax=Pedobacter westerhofensis TaxID=425512 RepID=A0A521C8D4_9SPHI|nr:hypothetical protein SAMN06265348_103322 [Pedobacter westerhofensis]